MVLNDYKCTKCDNIIEATPKAAEIELKLYCEVCQGPRIHELVITGGLKSRWRENDIPTDPAYYRGMVTASAPTATFEDGEAVKDSNGNAMHNNSKLFSDEARQEKRNRIHFETDKKRGKIPIWSK